MTGEVDSVNVGRNLPAGSAGWEASGIPYLPDNVLRQYVVRGLPPWQTVDSRFWLAGQLTLGEMFGQLTHSKIFRRPGEGAGRRAEGGGGGERGSGW